jgi:hypothetical protein
MSDNSQKLKRRSSGMANIAASKAENDFTLIVDHEF